MPFVVWKLQQRYTSLDVLMGIKNSECWLSMNSKWMQMDSTYVVVFVFKVTTVHFLREVQMLVSLQGRWSGLFPTLLGRSTTIPDVSSLSFIKDPRIVFKKGVANASCNCMQQVAGRRQR